MTTESNAELLTRLRTSPAGRRELSRRSLQGARAMRELISADPSSPPEYTAYAAIHALVWLLA